MTPDREERVAELRRIFRMLQATAEGVGMDCLNSGEGGETGARRLGEQFCATLERLRALGIAPERHFPALPADAPLNEILIAYSQLAAYIGNEADSETPQSGDQGVSGASGGAFTPAFVAEAVGCLDEVEGDIEQLREQLHDLTRRFHGAEGPEEELRCLEEKELAGVADELFMLGHMLRQLVRDVRAAGAVGRAA